MYGTSDFKKGLKILVRDEPCVILDFQHIKPGKGNQFTRTKLKNLMTGSNMDLTCRSGEKFGIPDIVYKNLSFTYKSGGVFHFMDLSDYETLELNEKIVGQYGAYLTEGLQVSACFFNGRAISIEIPKSLVLKVIKTEPGFKGNTVSKAMKSAKLETGLTVQVPLHISEGDRLKINTEDGSYIERANLQGES